MNRCPVPPNEPRNEALSPVKYGQQLPKNLVLGIYAPTLLQPLHVHSVLAALNPKTPEEDLHLDRRGRGFASVEQGVAIATGILKRPKGLGVWGGL